MNFNLNIRHVLLVLLLMRSVLAAQSRSIDLQTQTAAWALYNHDDAEQSQTGMRFIPSLFAEKALAQKYNIGIELSVHTFGYKIFDGSQKVSDSMELKPYRLWLRMSTEQLEVRAGLQKINFGSAMMLRPLMWFDRMDPRDPLQLTDGVYALLLRYYFLNNANVWLWGMYGNDDLKGWEFIPGAEHALEYGGRVQLPLATGEIGFSVHRRRMDLHKGLLGWIARDESDAMEQRFALDGKWDLEIGCWFEAVYIYRQVQTLPFKHQDMLNMGADYTFGVGNGIHLATEYLLMTMGEKALGSAETMSFSAVSASYPLGILDMFNLMVFYDWKNHDFYRFINCSRSYDHWQINVMAFQNPQQFSIYQSQESVASLSGTGVQVMVVLNY